MIPCYFRFYKKKKTLFRGKKPSFIPVNKISTQREWQSRLNKTKKKNPILEAYNYLEYYKNVPGSSYRDVADEFNISNPHRFFRDYGNKN